MGRYGMKQYAYEETLMGKPIRVQVLYLPAGIHVGVYGGDLPHIGAVSVADPKGQISTIQFPGHRDGAVSTRWAEALAERGKLPAVVEAGIHYDNMSREGISAVLETTEQMLQKVLAQL